MDQSVCFYVFSVYKLKRLLVYSNNLRVGDDVHSFTKLVQNRNDTNIQNVLIMQTLMMHANWSLVKCLVNWCLVNSLKFIIATVKKKKKCLVKSRERCACMKRSSTY